MRRKRESADEKSDKAMVAKGVHEHESALHKGEPKTKLKLRRGGGVHGRSAGHRLDRHARGGRSKGHKTVNVIVQSGNPAKEQLAHQQGMQMGAALGARAAAAKMAGAAGAPRPPMAPPPGAGGPPMGGPPPVAPPGMAPRPPMRRGGKVHLTAGAGSGEGRLEKHKQY